VHWHTERSLRRQASMVDRRGACSVLTAYGSSNASDMHAAALQGGRTQLRGCVMLQQLATCGACRDGRAADVLRHTAWGVRSKVVETMLMI
jgi:hypothetical protein